MGLCSPEPATEEQLESVCAWAEQLAADMGLGEFQFTAEAVDNTVSSGGWQIEVEGLPVYQGFPVLRQGAPSHIGSGGMYDEALAIVTNNDGTLINLSYNTPLVVEAAEPVPLMDAEQTRAAAESFLRRFRYSDLTGNSEESDALYLNAIGAEITGASLALDSVRVGYTRISDGTSAYLLVPSVVYSGKAGITGTDPGSSNLLELYLFGHDPYGPVLSLDLRNGARLY